jgi:hypothetical protein
MSTQAAPNDTWTKPAPPRPDPLPFMTQPDWRGVARPTFALYVALYTVGRAWVEYLRVDHANHL